MKKVYINTKNIDEILNSPNLKSEYEDIYIQSLKKTKSTFELDIKSGLFIIAKEMFISDEFLFKSILLEIDNLKENVVAYNRDNTLFYYIAKNYSSIEDKINSNDDIDGLIGTLSSDFDFEKVELDDDIAFLLSNSKKISLADEILNKSKIDELLENGVFIKNPSTVRIGKDVKVESGVIIGSGVCIKGDTLISKGSVIENGSFISNSKIGENCNVLASTITDSEIGANCKIGPYAQIRPNTKLSDDIKIGNFVEVKNSNLGEGTKVSHLTYIGDSDLGSNINVGCGVVFVNYDGVNKYRSVVEDNVFIGCNSNLVSPVHIGEGAFIAAGSTITDDVDNKQLAIARARQSNKDGWKLKPRIKDKEK